MLFTREKVGATILEGESSVDDDKRGKKNPSEDHLTSSLMAESGRVGPPI